MPSMPNGRQHAIMVILRRIAIGLVLLVAGLWITARTYEAVLEYRFHQAIEESTRRLVELTKDCPKDDAWQFHACFEKNAHHHS